MPGGGISRDGQRWVSCRPGFFLSVRVLSRLFRRLFLEQLTALHAAGCLQFFGDHARLGERGAFTAYLAPLRKAEWIVYCKRPFGGPEAVLAYLSLYTHRIAISNSRLVAFDDTGVTFRWKDYRANGSDRAKVMTLAIDEFIRRFLIHVLPGGFHRIRHYGLFANGGRADNIARARQLLNLHAARVEPGDTGGTGEAEPQTLSHPCPCCGGRMIIIETFRARMQAATSLHGPGLDPDRQLMITTDRPTPPNATHRRRSPLSGAEGPRPMARLPCQITHCAICVQTNHSPAALLYCNLTTHALPDGRAALTAPG